MASFITNLFPSKHDVVLRPTTPIETPNTPTRHNFIDPARTPQGSPSKNRMPPGANDLPTAFGNAMKLTTTNSGSPTRSSRQNVMGSTPLSPGKSNALAYDDSIMGSSGMADESIIHKSTPSSPTRRHDKENTAPNSRLNIESFPVQNQAALSRQAIYETRELATPPTKKYNTQRGLTPEEYEIMQKPNVKRLANVTQLCSSSNVGNSQAPLTMTDFLDYYFDLLTYVGARQTRLAAFKADVPAPPETPQEQYDSMWKTYTGRERANLRKRRVRLRHGDFQILTQVGQGGYGQVFLAQKKDTREVCALKVMSKKLLFKLDEVRHVLTERDILTNAKSDWLVRLLYSFQDDRSIYLAMVCFEDDYLECANVCRNMCLVEILERC